MSENEKKHRGRIKNWKFLATGSAGQKLIVVGDFLDHEWIREDGRTSEVMAFDAASMTIWTRNSIYLLVSQGEASPRVGWPNPGDRMCFTNRGGYESEREAAARVFSGHDVLVVSKCTVGASDHQIEFVGFPGSFNGVMFEKETT